MDTLNDDELLVIFNMLNLNERTNLRLVSKRFKCLLDSVKITKLIIYEKIQPVLDPLTYTNESYGLLDTVEVYDLYQFFNNPTILKQMEPIKILVIKGAERGRGIDLKTTVFTKLSYLKLQNVVFTSPSILESTELEHLILESSFFNSIAGWYGRPPTAIDNPFNHLNSPKIKYLRVSSIDFRLLFNYFAKLFDSLVELDVMFVDFAPLAFFLKGHYRCPSLKTINCHIGADVGDFLEKAHIIETIGEHLKDLTVYLFGIPLNKASARPIVHLMSLLNGSLDIHHPNMEYNVTKQSYSYIKRFERDHDLSRFYQRVQTMAINCLIKDVNFFNKFNRCELLYFCLEENPEFYFKSVDLFSSVETIAFFATERDSTFGNEIFDLLPEYCGRLTSLSIRNANNKLNLKFVSCLVRLNMLKLRLCSPVQQCEFMQMIRTLKHLNSVDIAYVIESADLKRDELSKLKKEVNECLENELKRTRIEFKIEIHKRSSIGKFVRYILKEKSLQVFVMDDEERMFQMCRSASMNK